MQRTFRKIRIDNKTYFDICFKIYPFLKKIGAHYKLELVDLRWQHCRQFCQDVLGYEIGYIDKKGPLAGITFIDEHTVIIAINNHQSVNLGRQNFSLLHEIAHSVVHKQNQLGRQTFASTTKGLTNKYKDDETMLEIEADICASIMIANDYALMEKLKCGATFEQLKTYFETSNSAMETRLMNFLIYNTNYSYQTAKETLHNYKAETITLQHFFPEML